MERIPPADPRRHDLLGVRVPRAAHARQGGAHTGRVVAGGGRRVGGEAAGARPRRAAGRVRRDGLRRRQPDGETGAARAASLARRSAHEAVAERHEEEEEEVEVGTATMMMPDIAPLSVNKFVSLGNGCCFRPSRLRSGKSQRSGHGAMLDRVCIIGRRQRCCIRPSARKMSQCIKDI